MDEHTDELDADAAVVAGHRPPSARVALSTSKIVNAAIAFIDEHGLPGLTMRSLGAILGVEAMALYRYVPSKDDLLDLVVEELVDQMRLDDQVVDAPTNGWQDFLQRLAHGVRRIALAHPKAFPLVASRPPQAPWLRPPLRSLDVVETFLGGLVAEEFTDEAAVAGYRAFTSFLLGHLLLEVSTHGADVGPLDVLDDGESHDHHARLRDFPTVLRLRGPLSEDHAAREFDESLEDLLARMELIRLQHLT